MTERPILFSGPMVRAILEGRKTQTRRVAKFIEPCDAGWHIHNAGGGIFGASDEVVRQSGPDYARYSEGDRLWVREAHYLTDDGDDEYAVYAEDETAVRDHLACIGRMTTTHPDIDWSSHRRLRPSIHMPRWASRATLEVTGVKVERLQDISEDDAFAEGIETDAWDMAPVARDYSQADAWFVAWSMGISPPNTSVDVEDLSRRSFRSLWESINGPGSWEANPWVVAISFTRVTP